jgi:NADH:ubiquinone oxidoreductase subunit E
MCESQLKAAKFAELDAFVEGLDEKESRGSLIAVLHRAQDLFGYLPEEVQLHIARKLDITAAKVNGVVSFYSYFSETPKGENVISICMGTACFVRGAEDILKEFESNLGIKSGQATADGKYSIDALRCVGACGLAPVVMLNGKVFGKVQKSQVKEILSQSRGMEA